jgi:hypothetical protein
LYFNTLTTPSIDLYAVNRPGDGLAQRLPQHRPAGLSYGRQTLKCPFTRTALPQMAHKDAVRKNNHIHVPGLAKARSKLTVAHAQMLFAVPMEALRPTPAASINAEYSTYLPISAIGNEYLNRLVIIAFVPQYDNPQLMVNAVDANRPGEKPLLMFSDANLFAVLGGYLSGKLVGFDNLSCKDHFSIEFQVGDISSLFGIDMVEVVGMSKPAIEGEIAGDVVFNYPVDKLPEKDIVVLEPDFLLKAFLFLDKASELKWVMLSRGANVICDKIVVGNLEALLRVVPERADGLDKLAAVVDKNVVQRYNALLAVTSRGVFLEPVEPFHIELFNIPIGGGKPAIKTRLVSSNGKLPVDGRDVLVFGYKQTCEIFGEMYALGLVGEQMTELNKCFFDDGWEFDDSRHRHNLHSFGFTQDMVFTGYTTAGIYRQSAHLNLIFSILQKSSYKLKDAE